MRDELNDWANNQFIPIIKESILCLESEIRKEIQKVEFEVDFGEFKTDFNFKGFGIGLSTALFTKLDFLLEIIKKASLTGLLSKLLYYYPKQQLKNQIFELSWKNFNESSQEILSEINKIIKININNRVEIANEIIEQALLCYENILDQQIKVHQEDLECHQIQKVLLKQKSQELQEIGNQIKEFLNQLHDNE